MGGIVSSVLGGGDTTVVPTGESAFGSLPGFAQQAFEDVISRGTELSEQPDIFAPSPFTGQQQAAIGQVEGLAGPLTQGGFQERLGVFMNPFEEQVIQNSIRDLQEANLGTLSDIGQRASAAGGFGGTRQAVLEAEANRNLLRNIGDLSASTRRQGFDTATGNVLSRLGQESQLAGQLFGLGGALQQQQTAQQQAPLQAVSFLSDLARGVPVGSSSNQAVQEQGADLGGLGGFLTGLGTFF